MIGDETRDTGARIDQFWLTIDRKGHQWGVGDASA